MLINARSKTLLPHQSQFIQAPFLFPKQTFFFDVAGYGAGKTMALAMAWLRLNELLQDKKDYAGHHARIILGGVTLGHLEKTTLAYIKEELENSKTPYIHDKKNNRLTVGTVTTILVSLSSPQNIMGFDVVASLCLHGNTRLPVLRNGKARFLKLRNVTITDKVLTDEGWKGIKAIGATRKAAPMRFLSLLCSPDHRFPVYNNSIPTEQKMACDIRDNDYVKILSVDNIHDLALDAARYESVAAVKKMLASTPLQRFLSALARKSIRNKLVQLYNLTVDDNKHEYYVCLNRHAVMKTTNCDEIDDLGVLGGDDVTFEAVRAVTERTRQNIRDFRTPFVMFASTSQGQKGLYRVVTSFRKSDVGYVLIRGSSRENYHHPPGYVDNLYKMYNEKERRVFLEGHFEALAQGRVFGDFDWDKNYVNIPMDKEIGPDSRLVWAQDFNCVIKSCLIETKNGAKRLEDINVGDFVLTRKGYRSVLTKKRKYDNVVIKTGKAWTTLDHLFITPQGDVEAWKVQSYYYLTRRTRKAVRSQQMWAERQLRILLCLEDLITRNHSGVSIISAQRLESDCTLRCTSTTKAQSLKVMSSITKTGLLITALKVLNVFQELSTWRHTRQGKESLNTGKTVVSRLQDLCVGFAVKHLQERLQQQECAQKTVLGSTQNFVNVKEKVLFRSKRGVERFGKFAGQTGIHVLNALTKLVLTVELLMRGRLTPSTVKGAVKPVMTLANGRILYGYETEVWDIEVEGEHEFFANGVLVHNSGYHRGCVGVLRGGIIYIVKRYEFPDIREAPKVVRFDFPRNKILWVPDTTAKDQIIQFTRELHKYGIWWVTRGKNPNVEDSVFLVNKLLHTRRLIFTEAAKESAEAISLAQRDKNNQVPKGVGPSCVTADTRVLTKRGMVRIDSVIGGKDYALTRSGWRLVNAAFKTGYKEVGYFDGVLNCTKDHPIKYGVTETFAGDVTRFGKYDSLSKKEIMRWTRLGTLECLVLQMEQKLNLLLGTDAFGNEQSTQVINIRQKRNIFINFLLKGKHLDYILRCGKSIMVLFLTTVLYTTKISIVSITILKILIALIGVNTQKYMPEDSTKRTQVRRQSGARCQEQLAQHIIEAQKGEQQKAQEQKNSGKVFRYAVMFAYSAVKRLKKRVYKESLSAVHIRVTTVQKQQELGHEKVEVWCMNVADEHEFFAECAFVSNSPIHDCDSVRMLCYFLCVTERSLLDIRRATIQRHLEYLSGQKMIEEYADGYAAINPDAINDM